LGKGLRFCVHPKRWLPFFIIDGIFMGLMAYLLMSNMGMIGAVLTVMSANPLSAFSLAGLIAIFILLVVLWNLVKLWAIGALIQQSRNEKGGIQESFRFSSRLYPSLLGVAVVSGALGLIAGMVHTIFSILVGLVLYFSMQEVVIGKKGFRKAIEGSWNMFRERPVRVFVMWFLVSVIGGTVFLVFFMPLLLSSIMAMLPYLAQVEDSVALVASLAYMLSNIETLVVLGGLALLGFAIMTTFVIKASTEYYMQSKKRLKF